MTDRLALCAAALIALALINSPAQAGETGIASIHAWVRVGNKTCIKEHWHYGNATAATKAEAEKKAVYNWIVYTQLDYGSDWMNYKIGESRHLKCEKFEAGFSCEAAARACKLNAARKVAAKK